MRRRLVIGLLVVLALALWACGPSWQVVRQANPNPMMGQKQFAVAPIDFENLQVGDGSEAEYLADKDAEEKNDWVQTKIAMNENFLKGAMAEGVEQGLQFVPPPGQAPFVVQPKITWLEPGLYTAISFATWDSEVKMTVRITTPDGTVVDEVLFEHATAASMMNPGASHRLKHDGEGLGALVAKYLRTRVYGEE